MKQTTRPQIKPFSSKPYQDLINQLNEHMDGKEFEKACNEIVLDILTNYEGFEKVEKGPSYSGTPFDYFGFKKGRPYIIEFKGSLNYFHTPDETEKRRMQELLKRVEGLNVALLQVKLRAAQYRIFYNEEMNPLFGGSERSLAPVEKWIKNRLISETL